MTVQNMLEAYQVPAQHQEANFKDLATWCKGTVAAEGDVKVIKVNTRDGVATAKTGDRIVVDVDGHFHVSTASEFLQAYPAAVKAIPAPPAQAPTVTEPAEEEATV
jgi:hypothetical protein